MKLIFLTIILGLLTAPLFADQDVEEYRLLKSWGLEFNAEGILRFRDPVQNESHYNPWKPDLKKYQTRLSATQSNTEIDPLVISSKPLHSEITQQ